MLVQVSDTDKTKKTVDNRLCVPIYLIEPCAVCHHFIYRFQRAEQIFWTLFMFWEKLRE